MLRLSAHRVQFGSAVRIPTKAATDSDLMAATISI